jgi:hypothetical protein
MTQRSINVGSTANDGTGDSIRLAGKKINDNFTELYNTSMAQSTITVIQNNITATQSNDDIKLVPAGTGAVNMSALTVDQTIRLSNNEISVNNSNADLVLAASGSGSLQITASDINGGNIDGTVIGDTTPAAATFSTLSYNNGTVIIDGVTITDNTISTNTSNSNLEFTASGTGYVTINSIQLPHVDGTLGQVLKTNGSNTLDWFTSSILFDQTDMIDATVTVLGNLSSAQVIDSFAVATYRSAKYQIQISDVTADRYTLLDVAVMHDGSTAYISTYGISGNGNGDGSTIYDGLDFSVDINGGNVRLLGTVNNTNDHSVKLVRRTIKV